MPDAADPSREREGRKDAKVAKEDRRSYKSLYRALSENGNPRLSSLVSILNALGLELSVQPRHRAA